jgi:hypothetical protein
MKSTLLVFVSVLVVALSSCTTTPTKSAQSQPQTSAPTAGDIVTPAVKAP